MSTTFSCQEGGLHQPYWYSWPDLSPFAKTRFALPDYLTEHVWGWVSKFDLLATQQPGSFRELEFSSPAQVSVLRMLGVRDAVELPQESLVGQETDNARVLNLPPAPKAHFLSGTVGTVR